MTSGVLDASDPEGEVKFESLPLANASALDLSRSYCFATCFPKRRYWRKDCMLLRMLRKKKGGMTMMTRRDLKRKKQTDHTNYHYKCTVRKGSKVVQGLMLFAVKRQNALSSPPRTEINNKYHLHHPAKADPGHPFCRSVLPLR